MRHRNSQPAAPPRLIPSPPQTASRMPAAKAARLEGRVVHGTKLTPKIDERQRRWMHSEAPRLWELARAALWQFRVPPELSPEGAPGSVPANFP